MASQASPPFIVGFYDASIQRKDMEGRTLDDILAFSDSELEYHHDFIQYLFPLPEPSPINPYAPTITKEVRAAFLSRSDLREQMKRSLERMLHFFGFAFRSASNQNVGSKIIPEPDFEDTSRATWRTRMDHNHLRISRILRSLRVLGLEMEAKAFHKALLENDQDGDVGQRTKLFWSRATERELHLAPQDSDIAEGIVWLREDAGSGNGKDGLKGDGPDSHDMEPKA